MQPEGYIHQPCRFRMGGHVFDALQQIHIVALVADGYDESGANVQCNADTPKVTLRADTGDGTYRWYEIEYLCGRK